MKIPATLSETLPAQDLVAPTLFAPDRAATRAWLATLPRANMGRTARSLLQALSELNRVRLHPSRRLEILETMRPPLYFLGRGLAKHYLNQPVVLPEHARKVARLADTLFSQLAMGYTRVAVDAAEADGRSETSHPEPLRALAVQRAIAAHSQNLLRRQQLYRPPRRGLWQQLHALYAITRAHERQQTHADQEGGPANVTGSYLRALLLAATRPNQLRQNDLADVFNALGEWSGRARLTPIAGDSLFLVDSAGDDGPLYRTDHGDVSTGFSLDTDELVRYLEALHAAAGSAPWVSESGRRISTDLLSHLIVAWGVISRRSFMRLEAHEEMVIAVGLSAVHHFLSDGQSLEALVRSGAELDMELEEENLFLRQSDHHPSRVRDIWDSPYESNFGRASVALESIDYHIKQQRTQETETASRERYRSHQVGLVNASPGGYCLQWPPDDPAQLRNGEVIGIRAAPSGKWSIATIRWVQQSDDDTVQLGVELLSPAAEPWGGRAASRHDAGEIQRVLLLPQIRPMQQAETLLAPKLPFREGQKVSLLQRGRETKVLLNRKIASSGAFSQFEFRRLEGVNTTADESRSSGFDSLWDTL